MKGGRHRPALAHQDLSRAIASLGARWRGRACCGWSAGVRLRGCSVRNSVLARGDAPDARSGLSRWPRRSKQRSGARPLMKAEQGLVSQRQPPAAPWICPRIASWLPSTHSLGSNAAHRRRILWWIAFFHPAPTAHTRYRTAAAMTPSSTIFTAAGGEGCGCGGVVMGAGRALERRLRVQL